MTGEVINLRRERKRRARAADAASAQVNRVAFGLTRAEKSLRLAERDASDRHLDGHALPSANDEKTPGR